MNRNDERIPLRQAIREQAAQDQLDPIELARLRQLSEGTLASPARRRWLTAAAAIGGSAVIGPWVFGMLGNADNAQRLAGEIAYNHLASSPLDVTSGDLVTLRAAFARLGFSLLDPRSILNVPGELVGGRFCSVASVPAALLRYHSDDGISTVYQARFDPKLHRGAADLEAGEPRVIRHARGVSVCLCNVQGLLLAIASPASSTMA